MYITTGHFKLAYYSVRVLKQPDMLMQGLPTIHP